MNKLYFCLVSIMFLISIYLSSASVSLNITEPIGMLNVTQNQSFNILGTVTCDSGVCNNFSIGLKIPNIETVTHDFSSVSSDCFGGTCLAKPDVKGPIYNLSGKANWGCGKCVSGPLWVGVNITQISKTNNVNGCVDNMTMVVGTSLCLETDSGEKWDLVFSKWPQGGGGFIYNRSIERGLLNISQDSLPFYITSGLNPIIQTLNSSESYSVNFSLNATGNIGSYSNLILFAGDQENNSINININPAIAPTITADNITTQDTTPTVTGTYNSTNIDKIITYINGRNYTAARLDSTHWDSTSFSELSIGTYNCEVIILNLDGMNASTNFTITIIAAPVVNNDDDSPSGGGNVICATKWNCTEWSACNNGTQTRNCTYKQGLCYPTMLKPAVKQNCTTVTQNRTAPNLNNTQRISGGNYTANRTMNQTTQQSKDSKESFFELTGAFMGSNTGKWSIGVAALVVLVLLVAFFIYKRRTSEYL